MSNNTNITNNTQHSNKCPSISERYSAANNYVQALNNMGPQETNFRNGVNFTLPYNNGDIERNIAALNAANAAQQNLERVNNLVQSNCTNSFFGFKF